MGQVVSPDLLTRLQTKVEDTKTILESNDTAQIETLNREDLLGDLFYAGGLGYFSQYSGLSQIAALKNKGSHKFDIGYGSYGYEPEVNTFFGIPRGIKTGGAAFNIRVGRSIQSFDGEKEARNQLRFQTGLISSTLEHAVPEQMFSDPDNPTDGVSAVKALQLATQQGQKVYQIDQSNISTALADLSLHSSVESEIANAVNQGRIVITHTNNISVPGWTGAGYLILDPEIMDGSYKISGGGNGGFFGGLSFGVMIAGILGVAILGGLPGIIVAFILLTQIALPLYLFHVDTYGDDPDTWACWQAGVGIGALGVATIAALFEAPLAAIAPIVGGEWLFALLTGTTDQVGSCFN